MELRELVGGEVESIGTDATVAEGAAAMQKAGVGSLAVVDEGEFHGIFTERDVVRSVASGHSPQEEVIGDWMTPYPDSFSPDMSVSDAADWMLAVGYRHLPLVEKGDLIGMASIKDILWAVTSEPID
ncbi:MAG: CBS domain-containing protein [Acidimicrobiia bacterium]|jgi:CBS domain-containing protein